MLIGLKSQEEPGETAVRAVMKVSCNEEREYVEYRGIKGHAFGYTVNSLVSELRLCL